ncbi:MAG: 2-oxoglutarate dehydrogenase component, partial [Frankiales bacterium]|nr:2-oxoglutarate dehydrogenase component [Frankiales bacterium]
MSAQSEQQTGQHGNIPGDFGANEWYIQELYADFQKDPQSVPETWRAFLADYHPDQASGGNGTPAPAAPAAAAP